MRGAEPTADLPRSSSQRYESLDGLRGVASLVVVLTHMMLTQPAFWSRVIGDDKSPLSALETIVLRTPVRLLFGGDKAVILFFVLSGFVLSLPWLNNRARSYGNFLLSRVCRIYIPYLVAMLISALLAAAIGGYPIPGASGWINGYGWTNHLQPLGAPSVLLMLNNVYSTWIDNPTWSLVWEMRVSLFFPLIIIPVARFGITGVIAVAAALWGAFHAGQSIDAHFTAASAFLGDVHHAFYYASFFLIGAILAKYRGFLFYACSDRGGIGSIAMVIAGLTIWLTTWGAKTELMEGLGAAALIVAAASSGLFREWLMTGPIQWLGKVSYSLYLIHVPIIMGAEYLLHTRMSHADIACIAAATSLLLAEVFYRAVERPSHELGKSITSRSKAKRAPVHAAQA
ncbi:peptidoglycan/LPS O-acetylase OafA/YrhL [Paraburkholderia phenoliruptrix]|uniref:acyltransferase family protein n=1 Tax=Paraburkholderia phenoliruptrix TaxID=252970 RepID=UPI0028551B34|nr:acyltransferase [Paraburkholderia phenoliruptrix]MDR6421260.1 peptidoglycan/LPS O-acetylase OafA/YrhL [Paraburkholderia phenoliruptrix]